MQPWLCFLVMSSYPNHATFLKNMIKKEKTK